jgi:hypothetical protein
VREVRTEFGVRTVLHVAAIILGVLALIGVAPIAMLALAVIALGIVPFVPS